MLGAAANVNDWTSLLRLRGATPQREHARGDGPQLQSAAQAD